MQTSYNENKVMLTLTARGPTLELTVVYMFTMFNTQNSDADHSNFSVFY